MNSDPLWSSCACRFDEAELVICPMRLERLPEIQQFVQNVMPKHPALTMKVYTFLYRTVQLVQYSSML